MEISKQAQLFFLRWNRTVERFLQLYSADQNQAQRLKLDVFSDFMTSGASFDVIHFPMALWECVARVARTSTPPNVPPPTLTDLESALLFLEPEQRLVALMHLIFGLPLAVVEVLTDLAEARIEDLARESTESLRILLGFPKNTLPSVVEQYLCSQTPIRECGAASLTSAVTTTLNERIVNS